ncbi:MAG: hypothetical protein TREMPRED_004711 [Tremellales sp. Tagirdzhanova-0007]|nr:MAG: hypothetical protein TREMPRED_004711 [Tremellales sp. Tagirdzhanova-0007]
MAERIGDSTWPYRSADLALSQTVDMTVYRQDSRIEQSEEALGNLKQAATEWAIAQNNQNKISTSGGTQHLALEEVWRKINAWSTNFPVMLSNALPSDRHGPSNDPWAAIET